MKAPTGETQRPQGPMAHPREADGEGQRRSSPNTENQPQTRRATMESIWTDRSDTPLQYPGRRHSQSNLFSEASQALCEMQQQGLYYVRILSNRVVPCESGIGESVVGSRHGWMAHCASKCDVKASILLLGELPSTWRCSVWSQSGVVV